MNVLNFTGRIAKAPTQTGNDERAVTKFVLIRNDYAGKDKESGEIREKVVSVPFTAFRGQAEAIAKHCHKGDQLIVSARLENNKWTDKEGTEHYDYSFIVQDFDFGAPGEEKRALLEKRRTADTAEPASAPAESAAPARRGKKKDGEPF